MSLPALTQMGMKIRYLIVLVRPQHLEGPSRNFDTRAWHVGPSQ